MILSIIVGILAFGMVVNWLQSPEQEECYELFLICRDEEGKNVVEECECVLDHKIEVSRVRFQFPDGSVRRADGAVFRKRCRGDWTSYGEAWHYMGDCRTARGPECQLMTPTPI